MECGGIVRLRTARRRVGDMLLRTAGAQQRLVCIPFFARLKLGEKARFAAGKERNGHAGAVKESVAGESGKPRPRRENAHEVERIGSGDGNKTARDRPAADLPQ